MQRDLQREASTGPTTRPRAKVVAFSCAATAALVLLVGAVWLVVTALLARHELDAVQQELPTLRHALSAGDFDQASAVAHRLEAHAHRAHTLTTGPAWGATAGIPWAGQPASTSRVLARQSDRLGSKVLPGVLELAHELSQHAPVDGARVNLAPLARAAPVLDDASDAATAAVHSVADAPAHTWLGSVNSARTNTLEQLRRVADQLSGAARGTHILLPMLGQSAPRRYFVGFLNEAGARGLGGFPGAFAIVTADKGTLTFTHFENDNALVHVRTDLDLGAEFNASYGGFTPAQNYGYSDASPHFPDAAMIWAAMWQKKSGEHIDGALAVDPTALSYLLAVTGPATMPGGEQVSASNVVALTEHDEYTRFDNNVVARKRFVVQLAQAVSRRLITSGRGDTKGLVRAAAHAASERRLVIWSADPAVEANLIRSGYAGVVKSDGAPFSGFVVMSRGAKLEYYLSRSVTYRRTGCGAASTAVASFTMTNGAPTSGLPFYITTRGPHLPPGQNPADMKLIVTYFGSAGARITSIAIDNRRVTIHPRHENGLVTVTAGIQVPVRTSRTLTIRLREPPATKKLQVLKQPSVRPLKVRLSGSSC